MELRALIIDDEEIIRNQIVSIFNGKIINEHKLSITAAEDFDQGIDAIKANDYDFVILDLCKGKPSEESEKPGYEVLKNIQAVAYIPVIFYSGLTRHLDELKSEIVGVVNKGDGVAHLRKEVERIIASRLALIKAQIYAHIRESLRHYFWEVVHTEKKFFEPIISDVSLGYLLLRRLANSLSKENIKILLRDDKIKVDKVHPMELYIFPFDKGEYEAGEILHREDKYYLILTPSCDFVKRANGQRKADKVLLALANKFIDIPDYKKYDEIRKKAYKSESELKQMPNLEGKLKTWMNNNAGEKDRFFFLPSTPFIENLVVDFQNKIMVDYDDLGKYSRVAKLDDPFSQSMVASFIRYYNRVGFPDIDVEYVMSKI